MYFVCCQNYKMNAVSSKHINILKIVPIVGKSLMYIKNNRAPKTDPAVPIRNF